MIAEIYTDVGKQYQQLSEGNCFITSESGHLQQYPQYCHNGQCSIFDPANPNNDLLNDKALSIQIEHVHYQGYDVPRVHFKAHSDHCMRDIDATAKCEPEYTYYTTNYDPRPDQIYPIVVNDGWIFGKIQWADGGGVDWVKCLTGDADKMWVLVRTDPEATEQAAKMDFSGMGCNFYHRISSLA